MISRNEEFVDVLNDYALLAEATGKDIPYTAWLLINGIDWPNPHYKGEPVAHPHCSTEFHPRKGLTLRERFAAHNKGKDNE